MKDRKLLAPLSLGLGLLALAAMVALWPARNASAQCGSQASSCKNCHEVQGQDPVNSDGTGWHQSHAFGDFCYICHAGNNQAKDKDAAHAGMVAPLSDVKAACQSCHPNDLMDRAQVYATALGVSVGTGGSGDTAGSSGGTGDTSSNPPASGGDASDAPAGMVVDTAEVIDYSQIYAGKQPVNWGNVILILLIGMVTVGGGTFVWFNERKLRGLGARQPVKRTQSEARSLVVPKIEGYSQEVLSLLPQLAQLSPVGLHALRRMLQNPDEASELLYSLSKLDPELVRRIRSLDRESRAMLLALSGRD